MDVIPPDQRGLHATFIFPEDLPCEPAFSFLRVVTLTLSHAEGKQTGPDTLTPSPLRAKRSLILPFPLALS